MRGSDLLALTTDPNSSEDPHAPEGSITVARRSARHRPLDTYRSVASRRGRAAQRRQAVAHPPRAQPRRLSAREASDQSRRSAAGKSASSAGARRHLSGDRSDLAARNKRPVIVVDWAEFFRRTAARSSSRMPGFVGHGSAMSSRTVGTGSAESETRSSTTARKRGDGASLTLCIRRRRVCRGTSAR